MSTDPMWDPWTPSDEEGWRPVNEYKVEELQKEIKELKQTIKQRDKTIKELQSEIKRRNYKRGGD